MGYCSNDVEFTFITLEPQQDDVWSLVGSICGLKVRGQGQKIAEGHSIWNISASVLGGGAEPAGVDVQVGVGLKVGG